MGITLLRAASHRAIDIGYVQNQHPINPIYPICLNLFIIKSAESMELGVNTYCNIY